MSVCLSVRLSVCPHLDSGPKLCRLSVCLRVSCCFVCMLIIARPRCDVCSVSSNGKLVHVSSCSLSFLFQRSIRAMIGSCRSVTLVEGMQLLVNDVVYP